MEVSGAQVTTNVEAFNALLSKVAKDLPEDDLVEFHQKICFDALRGVIFSTRVRTGRARGGWQVGIDEIPTGPGRKSKSGEGTKNRGNSKIERIRPYQVCYIANNVEYITYLEDGASGRPGDHMLALTLLRISLTLI